MPGPWAGPFALNSIQSSLLIFCDVLRSVCCWLHTDVLADVPCSSTPHPMCAWPLAEALFGADNGMH